MRIRLTEKTVEEAEKTIGSWHRAKFCYVLDHEPIITDKIRVALKAGRAKLEDIILDQRLREPDNNWYIDDYGFYLYAAPLISLTGEDVHEDRTQTGLLDSLTQMTQHAGAN